MSKAISRYFIIIVLFFCSSAFSQEIINGELNLSNDSEMNENTIELSGKWYFHYGDHLSAEEMRKLPNSEKQLIETPGSWTNGTFNGKKLPAFGIATYYLRVILENNKTRNIHNLGLKMSSVISAYNLYVNDKIIGKAGIASKTVDEYTPTYLPQVCYFETQTDTLDIIVHISNFTDPLYGGIWKKIRFGEHKNIETFNWTSSSFNIFILSAFLLLFLYQITISLIQKTEKSHLIIAFLSLISFVKLLSDGDVSIFNYFPNLDFTIYYRLWLWSFLILPLILKLTQISYPNDVNKIIEKTFYYLYSILIIYFLFFNIQFVIKNLYVPVIITFICILYIFYILVKAMIKKRKYSTATFISFSIMIFGIINDLVFLSFQFTYGYLSHLGIFMYISIQTITISMRFAYSHQKVIKVSKQLIESNKNLEEIVNNRTKELNTSNNELANINKQKDFLISTISHDLMGFFNTMLTYTKSLSTDITLDESHQNILGKLYQTSNKGYLLLENILTWAKLQISYIPEKSTIDKLDIIITENLFLFEEQIENKKLNIICEIDNTNSFDCNIANLNTIIRNLISNAIKFSKINGEITIKNEKADDKILITIHDNGVGIFYDQLINIFDPEKTKKREGTLGERGSGLGLMIVKELVETNNGKIHCKSLVNIGTSFTMEFKSNK